MVTITTIPIAIRSQVPHNPKASPAAIPSFTSLARMAIGPEMIPDKKNTASNAKGMRAQVDSYPSDTSYACAVTARRYSTSLSVQIYQLVAIILSIETYLSIERKKAHSSLTL
jgi:hypothetical protein